LYPLLNTNTHLIACKLNGQDDPTEKHTHTLLTCNHYR